MRKLFSTLAPILTKRIYQSQRLLHTQATPSFGNVFDTDRVIFHRRNLLPGGHEAIHLLKNKKQTFQFSVRNISEVSKNILQTKMSDRYDIVLYGATGFSGVYVLEALAKSAHQDIRFAVAGRCEQKLKKVLKEVSESTGHDLTDTPIIIADSSNENSLVEMAKKAKIIINVVGPYRLYGESVVKAAVENGTSHVDISGEPAFLEKMQMKYSEIAKQNGAYVVGACGWDSIPCDLGVNFLKQHFDGTLNHAETFVSMNTGPSGYSFNSGTYQTLILGIAEAKNDGLGKIRKSIMPEKLERSPYGPEHRPKMWYNESFNSYVLPFPGADRSVVQRSQYFDAVQNKARPVAVETYILVKSKLNAVLMMLWLGLFAFFVQFPFARSFMQKYPDICSAYLFKSSGPSRQQVKEASFTYWMFGKGWDSKDPNVNEVPTKVLAVKCQGPDPGYVATAGCVLSSALTILKDHDKLPHGGGVFTTTAAFKETKIYDRLAEFGIHFTIDENIKPKI